MRTEPFALRRCAPPGRLGLAFATACGVLLLLVAAAGTPTRAAGSDGPVRGFDVPAGEAGQTLKQFAQQAKREIMFPAEPVGAIRTNAIKGDFTALEAIHRMLAGTELGVVVDEKSGAFAINRVSDPNVARAAPIETSDRPKKGLRTEGGVAVLDGVEVTGSRLKQTDIEGFSPVLSFDQEFISRTGFATTEEFLRTLPQNFAGALTGRPGVPNDENPLGFTRNSGQSGVGLRGLGSNNTLVLINGRRAPLSGRGSNTTTPPQGFFDINTIPMGLIERIEVLTDGASAIYGTDAIGGVVNIILKKDYNETEARFRMGGTWHGGAFERGATLTHGFSLGKLRGTVVLDYFSRNELYATQRAFSKTSDQRARGGDDFRSTIGQPITVTSIAGQTLTGLTNPNGTAATQAVAPLGQDGRSLTVAAFAPGAGQRVFYDGSDLFSLITPTERSGLTMNFEYELNPRITFFSDLSYTYIDTTSLANPLSTGTATGIRIPATNPYNPFKQPLLFNLSHEELGPRELVAQTHSVRALFGARVNLGNSWSAEGSVLFYGQRLQTLNPIVDSARLTALLNETDPARTLNLFGDFYGKGPVNDPALYRQIISNNVERSKSDLYSADLLARGDVWNLPAGPIRVAVGGEWTQQDRIRTTNAPSIVSPPRSRETRDSYAAYVEAGVPLLGKKQDVLLARSLELQLAGRYENIDRAGDTTNPKYGLRWKPFDSLLLRGSYGTGYRAPALTELERPESDSNPQVTDPKRKNERYAVLVTTGSNPNLEPETSKTYNAGAVLNVPFTKGLSFGVDYYRKEQRNLSTSLTNQQLIDAEDFITGRVTRAEPTAADVAAGLAGRITKLDARYVNFGLVVTEGYDVSANYNLTTKNWGRFTFMASTTTLMSYKIALTPTDPLTDRKGSYGFPLDFKGNGYVFWNRGPYGVTVSAYFIDSFNRQGRDVGSFTTFDLNFSYEWKRHHLRFNGGFGNLFDREPPFANTQFGYDSGFHNAKQRTYNLSATRTF